MARSGWGSPRDVSRLARAVQWSMDKLGPFRENRREFIKQYIGMHFSDNGTEDKVPLNMVEMAANLFGRHLSASDPRTIISTKNMRIKLVAHKMNMTLGRAMRFLDFASQTRAIILDAMFAMGISATGLYDTGETMEVNGETIPIGGIFFDRVDFNDWCHDMGASGLQQLGYLGHRYRLPLTQARSNRGFNRKVREQLEAQTLPMHDPASGERPDAVVRGNNEDYEDYRDYVYLWNLFLPDENMLVTVPSDDQLMPSPDAEPLRKAAWKGPKGGPYDLLNFSDVPNSVVGLCPASLWIDLHDLLNRMFRKVSRQGERQKTILGVPPGAAEDGERVVNANDGDAVRMDNPDRIREYRFGGIENTNLAFTLQLKDLFTYMAGNLDALGGLGPQSETFSQDRLLVGNASKRVGDMQDRVIRFSRAVLDKISWYLYTDPAAEYILPERVPSTNIMVNHYFRPSERYADITEFELEVVPYSQQHQTPQMKLQQINEVFRNAIMPMLQTGVLQAQNATIDAKRFIKIVSEYANIPELEEILVFAPTMMDQQNQTREGGANGGVSYRENVRRNVPMASPAGRDSQMIQALLNSTPRKQAG